jgi:hypothetical protein
MTFDISEKAAINTLFSPVFRLRKTGRYGTVTAADFFINGFQMLRPCQTLPDRISGRSRDLPA